MWALFQTITNHEEADTLMMFLGVSATKQNSVDAQMTFFSPDTVLIIANYGRLPKNTSISMASSVQQIANMGSSGARQGKDFARTPCILWGRQHWTVCSDSVTTSYPLLPLARSILRLTTLKG